MSQSSSEIESLVGRLAGEDGQGEDMAEALAAVVARKNRQNSVRYLRTPYADRLVLLPQCLRSTEGCQAEERNSEYVCARCGACKVAQVTAEAEALGYMAVRVLKGGSAVLRVVQEARPKALLAVCCPIEAVMGVVVCERIGVPAFCVPLLRAGCSDTDVDLNDLRSALEAIVT
jgi:hypothetical protein